MTTDSSFLFIGNATTNVGGHGLFMENIPAMNGWHGPFGFRRNTPWLRENPSVFIGRYSFTCCLVPLQISNQVSPRTESVLFALIEFELSKFTS